MHNPVLSCHPTPKALMPISRRTPAQNWRWNMPSCPFLTAATSLPPGLRSTRSPGPKPWLGIYAATWIQRLTAPCSPKPSPPSKLMNSIHPIPATTPKSCPALPVVNLQPPACSLPTCPHKPCAASKLNWLPWMLSPAGDSKALARIAGQSLAT